MSALPAIGAALLVALGGWRMRPQVVRLSGGRSARSSRRWRARTRRRAGGARLADYLAAIAREVRGGGTVTAAFVAVTAVHPAGAPLRPAWARVVDGAPLTDALQRIESPRHGRAHHRADLDLVAHTLACAAEVGGAPAVALDAAASVLREREAVAADARAHSAQARLSARVLTVVPLAFAAWTATTDERARHTYLASSVGALCLATGVVLNGLGWWWMRRIVRTGGGGR